MVKNLHISILLLIFAIGIVGSSYPMTREYLIPPFPFDKDKIIERISKMSKKVTTENVIARSIKKHGRKYDYSLVHYVDCKTPIKIICPIHGVFEQIAISHIRGANCPLCAPNRKMDKDLFVKKARTIHGDKYDYSKVNWINAHTKIEIVCPIHGAFLQVPSLHLYGNGCHACAGTKTLTTEEFVERSKKIHGDKYSYSSVTYTNAHTLVKIVCPTHGEFLQIPWNHINGDGCPSCKNSIGEDKIGAFLSKHNIYSIKQKRIQNDNLFCDNKYFLVDFFIPNHNCVIEFHGIQHYKPIEYFGGQERLEKQQERDMALRQYCKEHGIKLIEIPYTEYDNIETILKNELLK